MMMFPLHMHSEQMTSSSLCFGEEETEQLIRILQTYSGEYTRRFFFYIN